MKVYRVWMDQEQQTTPFIADSIKKIGLDGMEEIGETWVIELLEMTEDEFKSLPEWSGP